MFNNGQDALEYAKRTGKRLVYARESMNLYEVTDIPDLRRRTVGPAALYQSGCIYDATGALGPKD